MIHNKILDLRKIFKIDVIFHFFFQNGHNVMKLKPSGDCLDSDDSNVDLEEDIENAAKERHSSGESNDSAVSFSVPTSPTKLNPGGDENEDPMGGDSMGSNRFLVIPSDFCQSMKDNCNLRGILRRQKTSQFDRKPRFESTQSESAATSGSLLRMMSSPACSNGSSGKEFYATFYFSLCLSALCL